MDAEREEEIRRVVSDPRELPLPNWWLGVAEDLLAEIDETRSERGKLKNLLARHIRSLSRTGRGVPLDAFTKEEVEYIAWIVMSEEVKP